MNFANTLTLFRLIVTPLFMGMYLNPAFFGLSASALPYALIVLLAVVELSDMLDGMIARRFNQVTDMGKVIDPLADSIWRISLFLTFTQAPINLPMWVVLLFLMRDSVISTLRTLCALKGFALAARFSGKLKAVLQGVSAFVIILLLIPFNEGKISAEELTFFAALTASIPCAWSLISGVDYLVAMQRCLPKF